MKVLFTKTFIKDFKKLPKSKRDKVRKICLSVFPDIQNLNELKKKQPKKMKGYKDYYRIRLGNYRIGFKKRDKEIVFMRVLHRKDIYRHFP